MATLVETFLPAKMSNSGPPRCLGDGHYFGTASGLAETATRAEPATILAHPLTRH
jgi:hypothetical protein